MPLSTQDSLRAVFASHTVLERRFSIIRENQDVPLSEYRSLALGAIAQLRNSGLVQLIAFWLSKKEPEKALADDLIGWLAVESPRTRGICAVRATGATRAGVPTSASPDAIGALLQRTAPELALLEEEAEAILGWLRRMAEARWKEEERASKKASTPDRNGAHR